LILLGFLLNFVWNKTGNFLELLNRTIMTKHLHLLAVFMCLLTLKAFAVENKLQVSFENFPYMSQLPSNSVQRVFQDKEGYIWFGTLDGLCRYDGYSVKSFRSDMNNPSLLTNNDILCLTEDDNNQLWIGTKQGVNILDKHTMRIRPFDETTFQGDHINSLASDGKGHVWIGTQRGLFRYNVRKNTLQSYVYDPYDKKTISGTGINYIYRDNHGNIWVMSWNSGICRYLPQTNNFKRYPKVGPHNNPFRLYQDKQDNYWIGTWGDGFYQFDPKAQEDKMYTFHAVGNIQGKPAESTIYSIVQDDKYGYLWLMSLSGLYAMNYQPDGTLTSVDISKYMAGSSRLYSEIIKDRNNNLWIGAFSEGVIFINFERPPVQNYYLDIIRQRMGFLPSIKALSEDQDGLDWIGLNRYGLCLYNRQTNSAKFYTTVPGSKGTGNLLTVNYIRRVKSRNEQWVACNENLIYVFKKKGSDIAFSHAVDVSKGNKINSYGDKVMFEDRAGNVWIGMEGGVVMVTSKGIVVPVAEIPSVTDITQDLDGNIWVSSERSGLCMLTLTKHGYKITTYDKYAKGLNTNNVQSVCAHQSGELWIGTKEGRVITFNKKKHQFQDVSSLCAMTGEGILNILSDRFGNTWISTNKKVTCFNPRTESSTSFSVFDNLAVNSFIASACTESLTGEVLFGGNRGFCSFLPANKNRNATHSPAWVHITDVKVHNQSIFDPGNEIDYDNISNRLVLDHADNNIEIEFSTLNYDSPSKVQYAYKLVGVDDDWIYVTNNHRFANYNNLGKGSYKLLLKATDENGFWSNVITTMEIVKKPAFYQTWWAKLIYLLIAFFLLKGFYQFSINRLRLRDELKIARIDKEKSEELTQTKLRYFTNISHELLTPLTIISCLIDDLELSYKDKFWQHEVMKVNVNRLKRLLQQILDFRKVESGNMQLKVSENDMVGFVNRICQYNFKPLAKDKQIHFSMVSSETSMMAWFDADKLDTALFNLLSNAFKYTASKGAIQVNLDRIDKNGQQFARLTVKDTGRGIAEEDIDHIFTRFYSNDPTNTVENHGIGLTLTKEMLELHHGTILVESQLNVGSVFTVEIPIDKDAYAPSERIEKQQLNQTPEQLYIGEQSTEGIISEEAVAKEDVNVLIVEDNSELRLLIDRIFSKRYHTFTAENGAEAMKVVGKNQIDIVVSDIIMPEMDGLELCRTLKNDLSTSHIAVLLLTAKNSDNDRIDSYKAGADGYLSKPFDLNVLDAKISSMVRNRRRKSERFKTNAELNVTTLEMASIDEKFLESAINVIEEHLAETDFDLDMFSGKLNMSKSSLYRKIKSLTGMSPVEFTKNIRLKHACQLLNRQAGNVSDIAYSVGFADPKYFTSCFKAEFGITPTEYVKRNKEQAQNELGLN